MTIFNKERLASLKNQFGQAFYYLSGSKVIEQRDANLKNFKGGAASVNRTELAMQVFADSEVQLGYEKFLASLSSFQYLIEADDLEVKNFIADQVFEHWSTILQGLALSRVTGLAGLEKVFSKNSKNQIVLETLLPFDTSRIVYSVPDAGYQYLLRITTDKNPFDGELVVLENFLIHKHYSVMIDNPYGLGIGGLLAEIIACKSALIMLWQKIIEKYSEPVISITVPNSASDEEIDEFFEAIKNLKNSARFILPEGFQFDVHNLSSTGLADLILPLIDRLDRSIMSLMVGESLTAKETSNGSNARDIVARDISIEKGLLFAQELCFTINSQLIKQLLAYNFPGKKARLVVSSPENISEILDIYLKAKQLGLNPDLEWLANKLGIKQAPKKATLGQAV